VACWWPGVEAGGRRATHLCYLAAWSKAKQRRNRATATLLCYYPWLGCGVGGFCNGG